MTDVSDHALIYSKQNKKTDGSKDALRGFHSILNLALYTKPSGNVWNAKHKSWSTKIEFFFKKAD